MQMNFWRNSQKNTLEELLKNLLESNLLKDLYKKINKFSDLNETPLEIVKAISGEILRRIPGRIYQRFIIERPGRIPEEISNENS